MIASPMAARSPLARHQVIAQPPDYPALPRRVKDRHSHLKPTGPGGTKSMSQTPRRTRPTHGMCSAHAPGPNDPIGARPSPYFETNFDLGDAQRRAAPAESLLLEFNGPGTA